jgi:SagB-type dehydrogenase family enzyme
VATSRIRRIPPGERYRRSSALVLFWDGAHPICFDCVTGQRSVVTAEVMTFLSSLTRWQTVNKLVTAHRELGSARDVKELFEALVVRGLVERRTASTEDWPWREWMPEAAYFHFGTRMDSYPQAPLSYDRQLRLKASLSPPPAATKSMAGPRLDLPVATMNGSLGSALTSRRTWRRFSSRPLALNDVATLLHLTWGVQRWGLVRGQGRIALKTSPSGGARHSLEAYVVALNIAGVAPGVYHYDAGTHELVLVGEKISQERLAHTLANQRWFLRAGALVVMSAVFERAMWRYPYSRAYRSILTEAGHLGQTFCLIATALGLAPFCTMAFRDRDLDTLIGVDGLSECSMYVVGAGTRPRGRIVHPGRIPARTTHVS